MKNLYICFTPFHLLQIILIILIKYRNEDNYIILSEPISRFSYYKEKINLLKKIGIIKEFFIIRVDDVVETYFVKNNNLLEKVINYFLFRKNFYKNFKLPNIKYIQFDNIFTGHDQKFLFREIKKITNRKNINKKQSIILLMDGLTNFINISKNKSLSEKLIGIFKFIIGGSFFKFESIGSDKDIDEIWIFNPKKIPIIGFSKNVLKKYNDISKWISIEIIKKSSESLKVLEIIFNENMNLEYLDKYTDKPNIIFYSQKLSYLFNEKFDENSFYECLIDLSKINKINLFIKLHPSQNDRIKDFQKDKNIYILPPEIPAEVMCLMHYNFFKYAKHVSFSSSSLINLISLFNIPPRNCFYLYNLFIDKLLPSVEKDINIIRKISNFLNCQEPLTLKDIFI